MAWTTPRTWTDGELVTASIMNTHVRDNLNASASHLIVRKTPDQSVTSSTTLVNDSQLVLPLLASEIWQFRFFVVYSASSAGDMKVAFTFPTGGDLRMTTIYQNSTGSVTVNDFSTTTSPTTSRDYAGNGASAYQTVPFEGVFVNGANAGNLTLQFAQQTSDGTATTIKANSTLWGVKLA